MDMIPYWSNGRVVLWQGHVLDALAAMEAGSVHCTVTSPPYWSLRSYPGASVEWPAVSYAPMAGLPPLDIPGCDPECAHVWGEHLVQDKRGLQVDTSSTLVGSQRADSRNQSNGQYCQLCGGWRGCLGLEPTPEMFVGHIVLIWRELWRVMRDDATCWLNFGDSYTSGGRSTFGPVIEGHKQATHPEIKNTPRADQPIGLKPKDLIGIPWRVAFALQADGWYLRSDIIWAKGVSFCPTYSGSCMPESVRDRPAKGHEYVFLLSKNKRYFYDAEAVKEGCSTNTHSRGPEYHKLNKTVPPGLGNRDNESFSAATWGPVSTRNLRSVWTINPGSYAGAHFATFPPALVEPMIKAGTSAKGCCPECGSLWVRVTERKSDFSDPKAGQQRIDATGGVITGGTAKSGLHAGPTDVTYTTTGWTPSCSCDAGEPVPCTVLDPFLGSGTTAEVAIRLGRAAVGIELSQAYCDEHIKTRLSKDIQMVML